VGLIDTGAEATRFTALRQLDASNHQRSSLHADGALWPEKNCYVDVWIELIHALGMEPRAVMPFTLAADFIGDQWVFFKPQHDDVYELYGIDVQELAVWKPLIEHAKEHLASGRLIATEADAFWLPDTAGTDYRTAHTKTTIVLNDLDVAGRRLGYLHNGGYHLLEGEDFDRTFRIGVPVDAAFMPLYAEVVSVDRRVVRPAPELRAMAWQLVSKYVARRPASNPVERFRARFEVELPMLQEGGLAHYHAWAFACTRQLGAAFELAAQSLRWIDAGAPRAGLVSAAEAFEEIASLNKAFVLKGARLVMNKRAFGDGAMFDAMAAAWTRGMDALTALA
jgi:Domain of unknown function (DUF1839)